MWTVYMHKFPNGKVYVGVTSKKLNERWGKNGEGYDSQLVGRAIKKCGWENIEHVVLFETSDKVEAENKEIFYISAYDSQNPDKGYNLASGGYVNSGFHVDISPETRKKIGDHFRGTTLTEEHKRKISESEKGKVVSEETKDKLRQAALNMSEETKNKISNKVKQRWSEGTYDDRIGNFHEGHTPWNKGLNKDNNDTMRKISENRKGFKHSEEAKLKISLASSSRTKLPSNAKKVVCVETGVVYNSYGQVKRELGIRNVGLVIDKPDRTAGKLHWRSYTENDENNN